MHLATALLLGTLALASCHSSGGAIQTNTLFHKIVIEKEGRGGWLLTLGPAGGLLSRSRPDSETRLHAENWRTLCKKLDPKDAVSFKKMQSEYGPNVIDSPKRLIAIEDSEGIKEVILSYTGLQYQPEGLEAEEVSRFVKIWLAALEASAPDAYEAESVALQRFM